MLRENKRKLFLSSAVILLPVLFGLIVWNRLPGTLITHWGADGKADGSAAKALAVFGLPLAHLLVHLLCLRLTLRDPEAAAPEPQGAGDGFLDSAGLFACYKRHDVSGCAGQRAGGRGDRAGAAGRAVCLDRQLSAKAAAEQHAGRQGLLDAGQ